MLTIDDLARGLSDKQQIDAIILDVPKAFDRVPYQWLGLWIILSWIEDFLPVRIQEVIIEGSKISPSPVTAGVPQGKSPVPGQYKWHARMCPYRNWTLRGRQPVI